MKLCTLSTGDIVYRYYKSIVILFKQPRKVLSTSVFNGGYREDLKAVFNHDCNPGAGMACTLRAPTYEEHMCLVAQDLGLDPEAASGMATAASMDNVSIQSMKHEKLTVTALVTGGVEVNGGRVGDPAHYYQPVEKSTLNKPGTINIMLLIDADMPPGTLARALVTCTEAKTAALQELMAGSNYSTGLATGSGTDSSIVIANPSSRLYLESSGKHSKLGEMIGCTVKLAVKEALLRQNGLSPVKQHSILRRLKRFGLTEEVLWQRWQEDKAQNLKKAQYLAKLHQIDAHSMLVVYTSLYVHLLDQLSWHLLSPEQVTKTGSELLVLAAQLFPVSAPVIASDSIEGCLQAWAKLMNTIVEVTLEAENYP